MSREEKKAIASELHLLRDRKRARKAADKAAGIPVMVVTIRARRAGCAK